MHGGYEVGAKINSGKEAPYSVPSQIWNCIAPGESSATINHAAVRALLCAQLLSNMLK